MKRVVIVSAKRTPFGKFRGALAKFSPIDLAVIAGKAALSGLDRTQIDQVILGNVLSAGHGMNLARQVARHLDLPIETTATTVNLMCGSGMQSALMAVSAIRAGEARAILVGGTESMSQTPLLIARPAKGEDPELSTVIDSMKRDGLVDTFSHCHMGEQAEELAIAFGSSRAAQDTLAQRSQRLYRAALSRGSFADELVTAGDLNVDEHPRPEITSADLAKLQPAFQKLGRPGSVTAGNSSGINDGAAVLLLAELQFAESNDWPILAEWIDGVVVGCDPARMGLGPVPAIQRLMQRTGCRWTDIDTLEINEAFSAQTLACLSQLELKLDPGLEATTVHTADGHAIHFNREGGAIAIGHPLAASGARLLTHLAWMIARGNSQAGIAALCIGGGMGIATLLVTPKNKHPSTSLLSHIPT